MSFLRIFLIGFAFSAASFAGTVTIPELSSSEATVGQPKPGDAIKSDHTNDGDGLLLTGPSVLPRPIAMEEEQSFPKSETIPEPAVALLLVTVLGLAFAFTRSAETWKRLTLVRKSVR